MIITLDVENIHCGACAARVTKAIQKAAPELQPVVDVPKGRVTLENPPDMKPILEALDKAGYPARLAQ
jgi:copper chaperone